MPISLWQKKRLYDIEFAYYFVRKMHFDSDRLAEICLQPNKKRPTQKSEAYGQ